MKPSRERSNYAYIKTLLEREFGRRLNPFFQGTIANVEGSGPWQVQVVRTGETDVDGNFYLCPEFTSAGHAARYVPAPGDRVECVWRDNAVGYILFRIG